MYTCGIASGARCGKVRARAKSRQIFRGPVDATAQVAITDRQIVVRFQKRAHNSLLLAADFEKTDVATSGLAREHLRLVFGEQAVVLPQKLSVGIQAGTAALLALGQRP